MSRGRRKEREREKGWDIERKSERETERDTDRQTEKERDRERERSAQERTTSVSYTTSLYLSLVLLMEGDSRTAISILFVCRQSLSLPQFGISQQRQGS